MTAFAMTEPEAGSDVAAHRDDRPARGIGLRPRRRQDPDLQRRHRRSLRRLRLHRPDQGRQGDQLLPGAGGCARSPVRRPAGAERAASAGGDRLRGLPASGGRAARRRGTRLRARPRDARPAAAHGGRRGLRDGGAGARRVAGPREAAAAVREAAGGVPAGAAEARPDGHRSHRRAAPDLSRGVREGPGPGADHQRGGDGQVVRHRDGAAGGGRRGAAHRRARACWPIIRWTACTARCGRSGSTRGRRRSSSSIIAGELLK